MGKGRVVGLVFEKKKVTNKPAENKKENTKEEVANKPAKNKK